VSYSLRKLILRATDAALAFNGCVATVVTPLKKDSALADFCHHPRGFSPRRRHNFARLGRVSSHPHIRTIGQDVHRSGFFVASGSC
jgi:hypothetical protein